MKTKSRLATELSFYEAHKADWLQAHKEEFVVIKGADLAGFYPSFEAGFRAGAERFGTDVDFLVKRIVASEPVYVIY